MSCITTLCQLFKGVALLIPIDNLPVKSTIFFMAAILKIKMAATKIIIEKCSLVQYTFFKHNSHNYRAFFHLVTFKTQVPHK